MFLFGIKNGSSFTEYELFVELKFAYSWNNEYKARINDMSIPSIVFGTGSLFSVWYCWKIHLVLINNQSHTHLLTLLWFTCRFTYYTPAPPEGCILFYLCPSICLSVRPSIHPMIFFVTFFSATYWWQKSDIWSQALFFDPSDSYFLFADLVGFIHIEHICGGIISEHWLHSSLIIFVLNIAEILLSWPPSY